MVFSNQLKKEQNLELKKKDFDWSQFTTFTTNHFYYFIKYIHLKKNNSSIPDTRTNFMYEKSFDANSKL